MLSVQLTVLSVSCLCDVIYADLWQVLVLHSLCFAIKPVSHILVLLFSAFILLVIYFIWETTRILYFRNVSCGNIFKNCLVVLISLLSKRMYFDIDYS